MTRHRIEFQLYILYYILHTSIPFSLNTGHVFGTQKHPHVIFEARTTANKGCANSGSLEWRLNRRQKHISGFAAGPGLPGMVDMAHLLPLSTHGNGGSDSGGGPSMTDGGGGGHRYKRDVREAIKYIETAIIVDRAMFEKRNGSTRAEVVHDAIQVANIADLVSLFEGCERNNPEFLYSTFGCLVNV